MDVKMKQMQKVELLALLYDVKCEIRRRRLAKTLKYFVANKVEGRLAFLKQQLERQLGKEYPIDVIIDDLLEQVECFIDLE